MSTVPITSFDTLFTYITGNAFSITDVSYSDFSYIGFNPADLLRELAKAKPTKTDLSQMCFLFLSRGTNIDQIIKKTAVNGAKTVQALKAKFKIQSRVKDMKANAISLSRIAASMPFLTLRILKEVNEVSRPVTKEEMHLMSPGYPVVLMTSIAASVIPKDWDSTTAVLSAICLYCSYETRRINKDMSSTDFRTVADNSMRYVKIAFNSGLITDEKRVVFCDSDVMEDVFTNQEASDAVIGAARKYDDMYSANKWE